MKIKISVRSASRKRAAVTWRTADPAAHILDAFELMQAYKVLGMYGLTPAEYLTERHPDGTKNQRLTISYYNRYMQSSDYSAKAAIRMIETYPDDPQMAASIRRPATPRSRCAA